MRLTKQKTRIDEPVDYPDGLMVDTGTNVYYLRGGKRYRVYSPRVLQSWSIQPVLGTEQSLKQIPKSKAPLGFRDGTLIHNIADGKMYLISKNRRRHITSPDVLHRFGWRRRDAITVSDTEANLHVEGDKIK